MRRLIQRVCRYFGLESGTTAVEYAVMLALILLLCVAAIRILGCNVDATMRNAANSIAS